ncbi:hypothetical protein CLIB1423_26S01046 [[Candida] railenensis]|uniref:Uncharacterized protein n=1 Tax=[Candida] railenensis TaxID=45579 RepID=A0A9P0QW70_9ASCO|nr:hypothetical protein CLIB1423_26S01046 [[Candida] railenensis]
MCFIPVHKQKMCFRRSIFQESMYPMQVLKWIRIQWILKRTNLNEKYFLPDIAGELVGWQDKIKICFEAYREDEKKKIIQFYSQFLPKEIVNHEAIYELVVASLVYYLTLRGWKQQLYCSLPAWIVRK